MADPQVSSDLAEAWSLAYLDPDRAGALGRRIVERGGRDAAWGWLHVALAEVRVGSAAAATEAIERALQAFADAGQAEGDAGVEQGAGAAREMEGAGRASVEGVEGVASVVGRAGVARGLALLDEIRAIQLRRAGDAAGSAALQERMDQRGAVGYTALDSFIAHNSRAITYRVLGRVDDALRHFHAALDAAEASNNTGAQITAACNLGGYQQDLYNLEDARDMCERAFAAARRARSPRILATVANSLILVYSALGEPLRAREMVDFIVEHRDELPADVCERCRSALALGHVVVGEIDEAEGLLAPGYTGSIGDGDGMMLWSWLRARCALARGDAALAREIAEGTLRERAERGLADSPYDLMELHRSLADACEALGDTAAALACVRRAHELYEQLVGRSARARRVALQVGFDLARAQRERDLAVDLQRALEADRKRLADLNVALERQVAENQLLQEQLREQALSDPLTGLRNRRYLFEFGPCQLELARRQRTQLAVVLLDLDHFKLLNDTYGHQAGDTVLQRFATLLSEALRESDTVCRHGGEEFVALMPDIDANGAQAMLSRLLEAYEAEPPEHGRRRLPRCTFSAGIALFPRHGSTLEQLLSRADRALYRAKQQGRARIEQAPGSRFSTLS